MKKLYIAKQKIFNIKNETYAYELLYRDHENGIHNFKSDLHATSHVLINALTNLNLDRFLGEKGIAFINLDEQALTSGIVDILDPKRFILEILETTNLTHKVIAKIIQYHKRGFKIAIDDFDCSADMIIKFTPILKYIDIIKMDVLLSEPDNLEKVMTKFKKLGVTLLAEKIETQEDYENYLAMGFDYFQGFYLHKPEVLEVQRYKDATRITIMQVIKLLKNNASTSQIEYAIKQRTELSYKLIRFLNNQEHFETEVESITQVLTLLGRDRILRWLLLYLYSETSDNPVSETIMNIAIHRAEKMEASAQKEQKDKAYIAGMFSMLDVLFETKMKEILKDIKMDKDITDLLIEKKGRFLASFREAEHSAKEYLKKLLIQNFDKVDFIDIIYALELNNIPIDKEKL